MAKKLKAVIPDSVGKHLRIRNGDKLEWKLVTVEGLDFVIVTRKLVNNGVEG